MNCPEEGCSWDDVKFVCLIGSASFRFSTDAHGKEDGGTRSKAYMDAIVDQLFNLEVRVSDLTHPPTRAD
jgi:hypothetical protein